MFTLALYLKNKTKNNVKASCSMNPINPNVPLSCPCVSQFGTRINCAICVRRCLCVIKLLSQNGLNAKHS